MTPAPKDAPSSAKATEGRPMEPDFAALARECLGITDAWREKVTTGEVLEKLKTKLATAFAAGQQAAPQPKEKP